MDYAENGFRIGDNVAIMIGDTPKFYKIIHRDSIFYVDDHSALAAASTESFSEITNLDPPINQLYQFNRIALVRGNVKVYVKQPAATNRFGTNKSPEGGYLTDEYDEMKLNLFCIEDYPPNVQIVNDTLSSITPRLRWHGYRYQIEKIEVPSGAKSLPAGEVSTPVRIGGISN